ncbi:hypothetical protein L2E82_51068 [Cichorium intybus]|nr:hypothetical protein L2E82_51068 [Cichorium intybus]
MSDEQLITPRITLLALHIQNCPILSIPIRKINSGFGEMAQVNIVKKVSMLAVVAVALSAATAVSAQAPAPSPDAGAAFSLPASGVMIGTSLLLSFAALFRN